MVSRKRMRSQGRPKYGTEAEDIFFSVWARQSSVSRCLPDFPAKLAGLLAKVVMIFHSGHRWLSAVVPFLTGYNLLTLTNTLELAVLFCLPEVHTPRVPNIILFLDGSPFVSATIPLVSDSWRRLRPSSLGTSSNTRTSSTPTTRTQAQPKGSLARRREKFFFFGRVFVKGSNKRPVHEWIHQLCPNHSPTRLPALDGGRFATPQVAPCVLALALRNSSSFSCFVSFEGNLSLPDICLIFAQETSANGDVKWAATLRQEKTLGTETRSKGQNIGVRSGYTILPFFCKQGHRLGRSGLEHAAYLDYLTGFPDACL